MNTVIFILFVVVFWRIVKHEIVYVMACALHTRLRPCQEIPYIEFLLFPSIYLFHFSSMCVPVDLE